MTNDRSATPRPLPDRPNLRHLKDQARDLLKAGAAASLTDAQFKIARIYGFASWPKLRLTSTPRQASRSTAPGSIRAARRAGSHAATPATMPSTSAEAMSIAGSRGSTS